MNWLTQFSRRKRIAAGMHIEILGTGTETIVFLPGLGGTTRYWASRVQSLEARYRVVLVDLLGFGQSPKPWTRYSVERHVHELYVALKFLGRFSIVGHSLGALIAVAYAANHPEQIRNIVLISMPYFGSQRTAYRYMRRGPVKGGYLFTNVVLSTVACILTRRVFGRILPYVVRTVPREVAEDLVKHTWRSSTSSLWEVVYRYDVAVDLNRLPDQVGLLCIHGDRDLMAPVGALESLIAVRSSWSLQVLKGVDHHPFLRDPDRCAKLIDALFAPSEQ